MSKKIRLFASFCLAVVLSAMSFEAAFAQSFDIKQVSDAYVGQPVEFEAVGEVVDDENVSFEWAFSDNVTSILIGGGGRTSSFTVLNTSPVALSLKALGGGGEILHESFLTTAARELDVEARLMPVEMKKIWNPTTHMEETAEYFAVNQKFTFEASVFPELKEKLNYKWKLSDGVSSDVISGDGKKITVWRGEPGMCSVEVEVTNRNGIVLGKGVNFGEVKFSEFDLIQSENRKRAWEKWNEALKAWDASGFTAAEGYEKALGLALEALSINSDDLGVREGAERMRVDNAAIQRAKKYAVEGDELRERSKWTECLASYRRSLAVWKFSETEKNISDTEETVSSIRLDREKAAWKRDMAEAYEAEKRYEDAIRLYKESLVLDRQEEAIDGAERCETLLKNFRAAALLKGEAEQLLSSEKYSAAADKMMESLKLYEDDEIKRKLGDMENLIAGLKSKAAALRREGNEHARRGRNPQALACFTESMRLWADTSVENLVKRFERLVPADKRLPEKSAENPVRVKNPEAARLLAEGTEFYRADNYEEALNRYKKSYEIDEDSELKDWIDRIEGSMKAQASIEESNRLIREGNALYSIHRYNEALECYKASIELYPNDEVNEFISHIEDIMSRN